MPTVLRSGPYRFFFYANDRGEPRHIHIEREDKIAKYWLDPIRVHNSGGFKQFELNQIYGIIKENHKELQEAWDDYFGR